jgi:benzoyl-CoA reductase/2-hydroxyglutaryl-CoA dehydratase subunit BcrC/BadD/HgdB
MIWVNRKDVRNTKTLKLVTNLKRRSGKITERQLEEIIKRWKEGRKEGRNFKDRGSG